jgi:large subunit ribosomal protein L10Ae
VDKCKEAGYDYIDADTLKKKIDPTDKKGKELKKWSANYKLFFVSDTLVRQLPKLGGPLLTKWGKFPTVLTQTEDLKVKIEEGM